MAEVVGALNDFAESPIGQVALMVLNFYYPGAGTAISAGLSLADSELNGVPDSAGGGNGSFASTAGGRTFSVRQSVEYRRFMYGSGRIGGLFSLIHQTNANREQHYLHTLTGHPVDAITAVYADGERIPLDGNGEPESGNKYRGHLQFYFGLGTIAGDADLQAALIANTDGAWTSADQQRHCGKVYVWVKSWSNTVFDAGLPTFSFEVRGKRLFDPRVAGVAISSSGSGAEPLITTSAAHGVVAGDMVFIQGHAGSTPEISGFYEVLSAPTTTTCTLQLYGGASVSVTGTGGTLHKCTWSQNAALCVADYSITPLHRGGVGVDYATEMDESLLVTAANACENRVSVAGEKLNISSVDDSADTFDLASARESWATGDVVKLSSSGTLPDPLVAGTAYYLISVSATEYKLATTEVNANAGTAIDLTDTGTGDHAVERTYQAFTVDTDSDEITLSQDERAWLLGNTVQVASAGTLPNPLAAATDYYLIPVPGSPNRAQLATSVANAEAGTAIDITGAGSGTFYITRTHEARYTANGVISTQPTMKKNLTDMVTPMVGDWVFVGGKYKIYAGVWRAPSLSIDSSDFRGPIRMETGLTRAKHVNTVKGLYLGPASLDQLDDYPPVIDADALDEDDGETFVGEIDFPLTNSPTMATRGARILLRRANLPKSLSVPGKLALWRHEPVDVINVDYTRLGLSSAPYQVTDAKLSITDQGGAPYIAYDLTLRETASTVYDHDPADEAVASPAQAATPLNFTPPAPTALGYAENAFGQTTGGGVLSWTASDDGFVEVGGHYLVEISTDGGGTFVEQGITTDTQFTLTGLAPGAYTAGVTAVSAFDVQSDRATAAAVVSVPDILPTVSGLELRGNGGNGTEFTGTAAKFVWRAAAVQGSYDLDAEPEGGDDGYIDPYFKDYEVRILKTDGTLLRTEHTTDIFWDYTFEKNAEDYARQELTAGAYREFTVEVYQRGNQNQISAIPAKMTVSNPAPAALGGTSLTVKFNEIQLLYTSPADLDWEGVIVWLSESASFTPSDDNKFGEFPKTQNPIFIEVDPDTTYYLRAAAFDAFGRTGLNQTSELSATSGTAGTEYFSGISADKITSGEIQATETITVGGDTVTIDGVGNNIVVTDEQGSPVTRAKFGKLGAGSTDYGLEVFDASGNKILGADGLGLDVVGAAQIDDLAVDTIAIADSATMLVAEDSSTSALQLVSATSWYNVLEATHTSSGLNGVIFIDIDFTQYPTSGTHVYDYRIRVDNVTKKEVVGGIVTTAGGSVSEIVANLSLIFSYAFASGSETVKVEIKPQATGAGRYARARTLTIWEPKK